MLRDCSDVSSRWDQQRLQSAQCNLPCWLRLPQRVSPKKPQNPLTALESRPSVMSPYQFLSRVRGHAHSQVLAPPLLRPFSFSVPRVFLGGGLFYCLQVNLHLHLLFFNVIIFLCRLVFQCTIQRFLNFRTIQLLFFCDFFF